MSDPASDSGDSGQATARQFSSYLRFAHENIGLVIDGEEDATVRYGFERDIEAGDRLLLVTPADIVFGYATVEDVWTAPIRLAQPDMTFVDGRQHPSSSPVDLLEQLEDHYPNSDLTLGDEVTVIYFDIGGLMLW